MLILTRVLFRPLLVQILYIDYDGIKLIMSSEVKLNGYYMRNCMYTSATTHKRSPTPKPHRSSLRFEGQLWAHDILLNKLS